MAAQYWVGDRAGRRLGPLPLHVLRDLVLSGRMRGLDVVSTDGKQFKPLAEFPEVAALFQERDQATHQAGEAEKLMAELNAMKSKPAYEVFGLKPDDSIDAFRAKFFALVRRFYPERIPSDAPGGLKSAYREMFQLLSTLMAQVEALNMSKNMPAAPKAAAPANPTFAQREFIGWERRGDDRVYCNVQCNLENAVQMFVTHKLVNLSTGGFFLATTRSPHLGEHIEVTLAFDSARKRIVAEARVVWENQVEDANMPRGFGCRFVKLPAEDKAFIQEFVRKALAKGDAV